MSRASAALLLLAASIAHADDFEKGASMKTGEFWYRMDGQDGKPCGFARVGIAAKDGGTAISWELRLVMQGTTYEELRTLEIGPEREVRAASMTVGEDLVSDGKVDGGKMVGKARVKGKMQDVAVPIKREHMTGMGFIPALEMPLKAGATWKYPELDEANAFGVGKECTVTCEAEETVQVEGADVKCWRFSRQRGDDKQKLTWWVTEDRRLVKADWSWLTQTLSSKPTKDLFQPPKDVFTETKASTKEWLELETTLPNTSPEKAFDWWTKRELLTKWWPPEAEIELKESGKYELAWKAQKWILQGTVKSFERGKSFVFTWRWNFDKPEVATQEVHLAFQEAGKATRLVVRHGPYLDTPEDQDGRKGHIRGWNQFGRRLLEELAR